MDEKTRKARLQRNALVHRMFTEGQQCELGRRVLLWMVDENRPEANPIQVAMNRANYARYQAGLKKFRRPGKSAAA